MKVKDAHEVASAVERSIKRVAGSETQALVHVEPAIPPHTRPDQLFGDVQMELESDERANRAASSQGAERATDESMRDT